MMAMTVDGKIAKSTGHLADWTSKADKKSFIKETKKAGVIIMGQTTYETIGRPLPGRLNFILSQTPDEYQNKEGLLEFFKGTEQEVVDHLESRGYKNAILGGGAFVNGSFLRAGLVDELLLTVEPKLFGAGLDIFSGDGVDVDVELIEVNNLDKNVIQLRYKVLNK